MNMWGVFYVGIMAGFVLDWVVREFVLREPTYFDWMFWALIGNEPHGTPFRIAKGSLEGIRGVKVETWRLPIRPGMVYLAVEVDDGRVRVVRVRRAYLTPICSLEGAP